MNTINNRFLKKTIVWISLFLDELSVHFDVFICTIPSKNIKLEYCYANGRMTIEFFPEMNNTRTSNHLLVIPSI